MGKPSIKLSLSGASCFARRTSREDYEFSEIPGLIYIKGRMAFSLRLSKIIDRRRHRRLRYSFRQLLTHAAITASRVAA
jgi:hypothetical protein